MTYTRKFRSALAGCLILGVPVSPALAGGDALVPATESLPMLRQASPSGRGGQALSMMDDKMGDDNMGMKPPGAPAAAGAKPMGMMDDDKVGDDNMGMKPQGEAGPGGGMPGMTPAAPAASPRGMAGGPPMNAAGPASGMCGMPAPGAAAASGGMAGGGMMQMMMRGQPSAPLDRVEGSVAFMRAEIAITEAQAQPWDQFAQSLREGRKHLVEARQALATSTAGQFGAPDRLEAYEHHLTMRLDSMKAARESFGRLYGLLSPTQKRTADELVVPVLVSF